MMENSPRHNMKTSLRGRAIRRMTQWTTTSIVACSTVLSLNFAAAQVYNNEDPNATNPNSQYSSDKPASFSDWTPRKSRMTYEAEHLQPGGAKGTGDIAGGRNRHATCANLGSFFGPKGHAQPGDTILVYPDELVGKIERYISKTGLAKNSAALNKLISNTSANTACSLSSVVIDTPVTVTPATILGDYPEINSWKDVSAIIDARLAAHHMKVHCLSQTSACFTVKLPGDQAAIIRGFHFSTNNQILLRPYIEVVEGGAALVANIFNGQRTWDDFGTRPTAIVALGRSLKLLNNTLITPQYGLALYPPQPGLSRAGEPDFLIQGNIFSQYHAQAISINTVLINGAPSAPLPSVGIADNAFVGGSSGYDAAIVTNAANSVIYGNKFAGGAYHISLGRGEARVERNYFLASGESAIVFRAPVFALIRDNLFDLNAKVIYDGIANLFAGRSSHPSFNVCRRQPFQSFGIGKGHFKQNVYLTHPIPEPPSRAAVDSSAAPEPAITGQKSNFFFRIGKSKAKRSFNKRAKQYIAYEGDLRHRVLDQWDLDPIPLQDNRQWRDLNHYYYCLNYSDIYEVK